jgi:predicted ATPase/DNA-binding SARP family transcriptional activator
MPPRLVLQLLGLPQLYLDDQPIATDRRKAIALLAYLAVNDLDRGSQSYSREALSALLWPDYDQAKAFSNLRRTIWEVHQALGEGWLIAERETICLNAAADIDLDIARFQKLLSQSRQPGSPEQRIPLLIEAANLYRNHFLTGFSLKDAYGFNEWAYAESEDLRGKLADALGRLSDDYCAIQEAEKAIPHARRLITIDPLNEASHRKLMEVYIQAGQHSAALKQYQTCEQILRKELGLDPQPETLALYKRIRKGEIKPVQVIEGGEITPSKHNLPSQLSSFIGRQKEQTEIMNLISNNRLVTLTGPGGIGKTSLALQVGYKLLNEYPNGVWFIALDSLADPDLVSQTVAAVFDIRESSDRSIVEILINKLSQKTALLIFDNCEHVVEACAQLATTLLSNCPKLKILATSREVLNVTGEATYRTPSLSIPEQDEASLENLTEYESIRLFTERAALASSSFRLTNENAQTVIDICRKVDGIPLAIELAAARVNMLQVSEILNQLQGSFALLSTDNRTASLRQQTLQASMDWSWGLLTEAEQTFMRQLAVFAGGWTLESASAVCEGDVLSLTSALVKKSLIMVEQRPGRATRYRFHEIVRQYAHRKQVEAGEGSEVHTRHLQYFLGFSGEAEPALKGPVQIEEWLARLNEERDNLRAALRWAHKTDLEAGLYISGRLQGFWESLNLDEGARWMTGFLQKPESKEYPHAKAKALHALGVLLLWSQDYSQASSAAQECLKLFRACGDRQGEIDALLLLGHILEFLNRHAEADKLYAQARVLARSIGDARRQALALFRLGYDHPDRQLAYWEEAISLFRAVDDRSSMVNLLGATARFRILLTGDIEMAQKDLDEAARFGSVRVRNINGLWEETAFAKSLIALLRGDYEQASALLEKVVTLAEESGNRMGYLWTRVHLGYVALRAGDLTEARTIFADTAFNFQKDESMIGAVFTLEGLAGLFVAVGKPERAAYLIGWADATRQQILNPRPFLEQANLDQNVAACLARMGAVAFWDAYNAGQKLSLDEAVAYSLAGDSVQ